MQIAIEKEEEMPLGENNTGRANFVNLKYEKFGDQVFPKLSWHRYMEFLTKLFQGLNGLNHGHG